MVEFKANGTQTVKPGGIIQFDEAIVSGNANCIHREGSGVIVLPSRGCACMGNGYELTVGGNVSFPTTPPTGETAATSPITLAFAIGGEPDTSTEMKTTPAAADEFMNVNRSTIVRTIGGCCANIAIENTSNGTIVVENFNLIVKEA